MNSLRSLSWRRKSVRGLLRLARGIEFMAPALLRRDDLALIHQDRYSDPGEVNYWIRTASEGLWPEERVIVPPLPHEKARAAVLGCGAGREAIGLARLGWHVTGIDLSPELLEAAGEASRREGLAITWQRQNLTDRLSLSEPVHLITLFNGLYNLIPTRRRRIELLRECRQFIVEAGHCAILFGGGTPPTSKRIAANRWRVRFARFVGGNRDLLPNDTLNNGAYMHHNFAGLEEVAAEAAEAGWKLTCGRETWPPNSAVFVPAELVPLRR